MTEKILEICCDRLSSAVNAQAGGADRIELCTALSTDGLTPSAGLIATVRRQLSIPVYVLIRPRPGHFIYTPAEVEVMLYDIHQAKALGVDGIVSGALTPTAAIDMAVTRQLIAAARPLPFTFHRAFDQTSDATAALAALIDLGAERVLTSGQAAKAVAGRQMLSSLTEQAAGRIVILAAGGIRPHNIAPLLDVAGLHEFHSSAAGDSELVGADRSVVEQMKKQLAAAGARS